MSKQNQISLTQEQYDDLIVRKQELIEIKLPQNTVDIERAKEYGDLSENAEYDAAKNEQGKLHAELRMIEDRLSRATIIQQNERFDTVQIGHTVTLESLSTGETESFLLIGQDGDGIKNVDVSSKLGASVLEKRVGDTFSYEANDAAIGILTYKVLDIS